MMTEADRRRSADIGSKEIAALDRNAGTAMMAMNQADIKAGVSRKVDGRTTDRATGRVGPGGEEGDTMETLEEVSAMHA